MCACLCSQQVVEVVYPTLAWVGLYITTDQDPRVSVVVRTCVNPCSPLVVGTHYVVVGCVVLCVCVCV